MYYAYVIKSINHNWFYVGLSDNIDRRFGEHNSGWVVKTKFYRPFILVHVEIANNRSDARKFEKYLKSGFGKEIIKEIYNEIINIPR